MLNILERSFDSSEDSNGEGISNFSKSKFGFPGYGVECVTLARTRPSNDTPGTIIPTEARSMKSMLVPTERLKTTHARAMAVTGVRNSTVRKLTDRSAKVTRLEDRILVGIEFGS